MIPSCFFQCGKMCCTNSTLYHECVFQYTGHIRIDLVPGLTGIFQHQTSSTAWFSKCSGILTGLLFPTGLWACTSECKVLGHSDRCWSPSATRPNTSMACGPHLSTFNKTASLPRNTARENYYPALIPKTNGLQSVYEKVQHQEFDYILVGPSTPARIQEADEMSIPEYTNS